MLRKTAYFGSKIVLHNKQIEITFFNKIIKLLYAYETHQSIGSLDLRVMLCKSKFLYAT